MLEPNISADLSKARSVKETKSAKHADDCIYAGWTLIAVTSSPGLQYLNDNNEPYLGAPFHLYSLAWLSDDEPRNLSE